MAGLRGTPTSRVVVFAALALLVPRLAAAQSAEEAAVRAMPGSPRPLGPGLSPEAPDTAPAAGGRAPSFGAPTKKEAWNFSISGSLSAREAVGLGRLPDLPAPNQLTRPLHVPILSEGQQPFSPTTGGTLAMQYGNSRVTAYVNAVFNAADKEWRGRHVANAGTALNQAYLTINPQPFGQSQLVVQVGAFTSAFAGPGQWGWGIFGPMLATRGYGISGTLQGQFTDEIAFNVQGGFQAVPGVDEEFVRGLYTDWTETGINSMVAHAHAGLVYRGEYTARLHFARAWGFDERTYLTEETRDGTMDVYLLEGRYVSTPFGQLGVTLGFWDLDDANHIHDAIWWGLNYTKGGSDMINDYVGLGGAPNGLCNPIEDPATMQVVGDPFPCTGDDTIDGNPVLVANGDGKVFAISAEYDTSIAALLWHPRPFTGTSPDLRLALAAIAHFTLDTGDPLYEGASGILLGANVEYQPFSWLSFPVRFDGEDRDSQFGRYRIYSISPGVAFRTDWQSTNRIELTYSRRFYNSVVDDNPARPLDPHVIAVGAFVNF